MLLNNTADLHFTLEQDNKRSWQGGRSGGNGLQFTKEKRFPRGPRDRRAAGRTAMTAQRSVDKIYNVDKSGWNSMYRSVESELRRSGRTPSFRTNSALCCRCSLVARIKPHGQQPPLQKEAQPSMYARECRAGKLQKPFKALDASAARTWRLGLVQLHTAESAPRWACGEQS